MRARRILVLLAVTAIALPLPAASAPAPVDGKVAAKVATLPSGAIMQVRSLTSSRDSSYNGWNWGVPDTVYPFRTPAGDLGVLTRDEADDMFVIDVFDPETYARVGSAVTVAHAGWPIWGGFLAGGDGHYYVALGRNNPRENDDRPVVAVRKYDADWRLVGSSTLRGGASQGIHGIYRPFDASAADLRLVGSRLVVHMGRLMYETDDGLHHQGNMTYEVDTTTMAPAVPFAELGGYAYSSHSFNQLLATHGDDLVMVDHGDAYPRSIQMGVLADYPTARDVVTHDLMAFNGSIGDNFTGAAVTGLVSGPSGVLVVGHSIRHPNAPTGVLGPSREHRNIFVIRADPATGERRVRWLTDFPPSGGSQALEPRVFPAAEDRYAVLFTERSGSGRDTMHYRLLDSAGRQHASASWPGVRFSPISDPVRLGTSVFWVGKRPNGLASSNPAFLYGLDVADPAAPELLAPAAAPEPPTNIRRPQLRGKAKPGKRLRVKVGKWSPRPDQYVVAWLRDGRRIRGADDRTFRVRRKDAGHRIRAEVYAVILDAGWNVARTRQVRVRR